MLCDTFLVESLHYWDARNALNVFFFCRLVFCVGFTVLLVATTTNAIAKETNWKDINGWNISFYPGTGACMAYTTYTDGVAFFIGLSKKDDTLNFEMTLMNNKWKSIEDKKEYEVVVTFGNETPWTLEMTGVKFDSTWGMEFRHPAGAEKAGKFVKEFMREVDMEWTYKGQQLGFLSLSNSRAAFEEAVACTKSYQAAVGSNSDPFSAGDTTTDSDPFAN